MKLYKKFPPFGNIKISEKSYTFPEIILFIGEKAWEEAREEAYNPKTCFQSILCLPPFLDPYTFQWPVKNIDVLIEDTSYCDYEYIEEISKCLIIYGADTVRYFGTWEGKNDRYFKFTKGF